MASPLIATKLHVPGMRPKAVPRPRLLEMLDRGRDARLTLISAPAGFGKTSLLAEWLSQDRQEGLAIAWLSLDDSDREPAMFWPHLLAALQTGLARLGQSFPELPGATTADKAFIAILVNQLAALDAALVLVLDDFHVVDHPETQSGLGLLLEHLPPHVRIVISTRVDPALPLPRLRARGELVEIRAADLRMNAAEATSYLHESMGLALSPDDTRLLQEKTEGWIAALQLAVISLDGRSDASAFIAGFAGSGRYIVDYLVEEVLSRLPDETRQFLYDTCILRRMNAALCNFLTGGSGAVEMLLRLERQNLFLVSLDDDRQWYRYHHLFADVLAAHAGTRLDELHGRASRWFEEHGERSEAIYHALAAGDSEWAAELIERTIPQMRRNRQEAIFREWMKSIPATLIAARPRLAIGYAGVLVSLGEFGGVEGMLNAAEERLADDATGSLRAGVELYRSALAQVRGELDVAASHAARVLTLAPDDDHLVRAGAAGFLGIVAWSQGELARAADFWTQCRNGLRKAGHIADLHGTTIALCDILSAQGRLDEAARLCEDTLAMTAAADQPMIRGAADIHASLAMLAIDRDQLDAAEHCLARSRELGVLLGLPQHPYRLRVASARLCAARGDFTGAIDLLHEAERLYVSDFFPNIRPIPAAIARMHIALGQWAVRDKWAISSGIAAAPVSFEREFEHLTFVQLLLSREPQRPQDIRQALRLLGSLHDAAEAGARFGSMVDIEVLQALAHHLASDDRQAMDAFGRALVLAAPEQYCRPFLDAGHALTGLLKLAAKRGIEPKFVRRVLAVEASGREDIPRHPDLLEPLSDREIDVLRLLRSDLSGPDIARELVVSLSTVRTHTRNIFEKLGVNNRRAAVRRAEVMQLFARPDVR